MIDRRELLTLGGVLGAIAPAPSPAESIATAQIGERQLQDIKNAIDQLKDVIVQEHSFNAVGPVRKSLYDYLRSMGKFPDYIEVGTDVWQAIHDWHIRLQQPLVLGRDPNGRYTLMLGFTAVVLRHDSAPNLIGIPYDVR